MVRPLILAATPVALALLSLGGCAGADTSVLKGANVPAERYTATFQAARDTLRDYRFALERVDAPQGIITTADRSSPGALKPWEAESNTAAIDDMVGFQERSVQVAFIAGAIPARTTGAPVIPLTDPDRDMVASPKDTTMLVRVTVHRIERPGRRVSMDTVRVGRQAVDPALAEQGVWPSYLVTEEDDDVLAAKLARAIMDRAIRNPAPQAESPKAASGTTPAQKADAQPAPAQNP
ncbi:MAG: hypothetical protein QM783_18680 [Phycisphaerales bacterium]